MVRFLCTNQNQHLTERDFLWEGPNLKKTVKLIQYEKGLKTQVEVDVFKTRGCV